MGRLDSAMITVAEHLYYLPHRRAHVEDWLVSVLGDVEASALILDFGGGRGRVATELAGRLGCGVVVADVDEASLARVPRGCGLAPVRVPPRPPLPLRAASVAAIVIVDALHHMPDGERTVLELVTCLRPGGVMALVEFEPDRFATHIFRRFAGFGGRRCHFRSRAVLAHWLERAGLNVQIATLDGLRYGVWGRR